MGKIFNIVFILFLFGCGEKEQGFKIRGIAKGMSDGTKVLVHNAVTREKMDSSIVINEHFEFSGSLAEKCSQVILATENWSDYKFFWLENAEIDFQGEKNNFRFASITGSELQESYDKFLTTLDPLQKTYDSLFNTSDGKMSETQRKEVSRLMQETQQKISQHEIDFVRNNPDNIISASLLDVYKVPWGHGLSKTLYTPMTQEVKDSYYGKNINRYLTLNRNLKVGDLFVDFVQENREGKKIKPSDYSGKFVLLEFWASWCAPCRKENPELVKLYQKHKNKGFEILGISLDIDKEDWIAAVKNDGLLWENVSDLKGDENEAAMIYGVAAIPDNLLIDPKGIIIARNLRGEELKEKIAEISNL